MSDLRSRLEDDLADAERKAWDALARWKFWMFGYHAARCVLIKRQLGRSRQPMFKDLVELARKVMLERYGVQIPSPDNGTARGRASRSRSAHPTDAAQGAAS